MVLMVIELRVFIGSGGRAFDTSTPFAVGLRLCENGANCDRGRRATERGCSCAKNCKLVSYFEEVRENLPHQLMFLAENNGKVIYTGRCKTNISIDI
jgi:hypothetical protein